MGIKYLVIQLTPLTGPSQRAFLSLFLTPCTFDRLSADTVVVRMSLKRKSHKVVSIDISRDLSFSSRYEWPGCICAFSSRFDIGYDIDCRVHDLHRLCQNSCLHGTASAAPSYFIELQL